MIDIVQYSVVPVVSGPSNIRPQGGNREAGSIESHTKYFLYNGQNLTFKLSR